MIDQWLSSHPSSPLHKLYGQVDVIEIADPTDGIKSYLGKELVDSYRQLEFLKFHYQALPESELRAYLKNYTLPSDKNQITKNVRQGDFAEVLAQLIVSFFEKRAVPLKKMRWKFNADRSVFSTDMLAHNDGDPIADLYYYEIKSKLNNKKSSVDGLHAHVTIHAHNSLLKDTKLPHEGIADFLSRQYFEKADFAQAKKYHDIVQNPGKYNKHYELFFIIDAKEFISDILDDLEALPPTLSPLGITIVLIKNLGKLILEVRDNAIEQAVNHVHPKP